MASAPRRAATPVANQSPEARSYFTSRGYKRRDLELPPGFDVLHELDPWDVIHAASAGRPDTPHVRALRFLNGTGELLSAVILVAGTIAGYGVLRPF